MSSSLNPLNQFSPVCTWDLLLKGYCLFFSNGSALLKKMAAMPIHGEKHLNLLKIQESFEAEPWYIASGMQGLPSLFK